MIGHLIGPYRITRPLGRGGMGSVFAARHDDIGVVVAVKVLHPQFTAAPQMVRRFHDEARAIAAVRHPGLVKIFDFGQLADGTAYLLMEFLEGETLARRLKDFGGRLPRGEAVRVARQLATALIAAHQKGIVHCDLKPGNVMLVADPEIPDGERTKLLDFGLAKILSRSLLSEPGREATEMGVLLGTPMYMAPEQCRGRSDVSAQADVYALGVMLYQMLAGAPPFDGGSPADLMSRHILVAPVPLSQRGAEAGPELAGLVAQMLAKSPAERPQMDEVAARLEALREERSLIPAPTQVAAAIAPVAPAPAPEGVRAPGRAQGRELGRASRSASTGSGGSPGKVLVAGLLLLAAGGAYFFHEKQQGTLQLMPQMPAEQAAPAGKTTALDEQVALTIRFRIPKEQRDLTLTCNGIPVPLRCFADAPNCSATADVSHGEECHGSLTGYQGRDIPYDRLRTDPALLRNGREVFVPLTLDPLPRRKHR